MSTFSHKLPMELGGRGWVARLLLALIPLLVAVAGANHARLPWPTEERPFPSGAPMAQPSPVAALPSLRLKGESLLHSLPPEERVSWEVSPPEPLVESMERHGVEETPPLPEPFAESMERHGVEETPPLPEPLPKRRPLVAREAGKGERVDPRPLAPVPQQESDLEEAGARLLEMGANQRAEAVWRQALIQTPERLSVRRRLARLWVAMGRDAEARSLLEESPQGSMRDWRGLARSDPQAAALLAALYHKAQRPWEAVALYEALLAGDGRQGAWWLGLALALEQVGEQGEAMVAYRAALGDERLGREARRYARQRLQGGGMQ